jgi:predicted  nucleic acid-binding Zn-ribbon protein
MDRKCLNELIEVYREAKAGTEAADQKIDEVNRKIEKLGKRISKLDKRLGNTKKKRDRVFDDLTSGAATEAEYFAALEQHKKVHDTYQGAVLEFHQFEEVLELIKEDRALLTRAAHDAAVRLADFVVANRRL